MESVALDSQASNKQYPTPVYDMSIQSVRTVSIQGDEWSLLFPRCFEIVQISDSG